MHVIKRRIRGHSILLYRYSVFCPMKVPTSSVKMADVLQNRGSHSSVLIRVDVLCAQGAERLGIASPQSTHVQWCKIGSEKSHFEECVLKCSPSLTAPGSRVPYPYCPWQPSNYRQRVTVTGCSLFSQSICQYCLRNSCYFAAIGEKPKGDPAKPGWRHFDCYCVQRIIKVDLNLIFVFVSALIFLWSYKCFTE